jgi:hypothetical protein
VNQKRQLRPEIIVVAALELTPQCGRPGNGNAIGTLVIRDRELKRFAQMLRKSPRVLFVNEAEIRAHGVTVQQIDPGIVRTDGGNESVLSHEPSSG